MAQAMSQWTDHAAQARTEAARWRATPACPRCGFPEGTRTTAITQCRMSCCHATGTGLPSVGQDATKLPSSWPFYHPLPTVLAAPIRLDYQRSDKALVWGGH